MRRTKHSGKVDANQREIVDALRKCGISVQSLASIGDGCPDLLAADFQRVWVIEVKGPKGSLRPEQEAWINAWRGTVHVVRSVDDALRLVGVMT